MVNGADSQPSAIGFGVVAGLSAALLAPLAREVERLGYGSFWINDGGRPEADGLAGLVVVAEAAPSLAFGVGVLPLDRRTPAHIAAALARLDLPLDRLRLGVGSGGDPRPLGRVRVGVAELRDLLPTARIVISALGPKMSHLAGQIADGVLCNWATPAQLAVVSALVEEGERSAGRSPIERWTYVRGAIGADARTRLGEEAQRYASGVAYGRAFAAMGAPFETVGIAGDDLWPQVQPYRQVIQGVVVRALPREWLLEEAIAIARAAAPNP